MAHGILSARRSTASNTYRAGPGKSKTGGNSEAQTTGTMPLLYWSGTGRVPKLCIIQVGSLLFSLFDQ
jgi:hypothetical protein